MDMLFINVLLFIKAGSPRPSAAQQGVVAGRARLLKGRPACPGHRSAPAPRRGGTGAAVGGGRARGTQARTAERRAVRAAA